MINGINCTVLYTEEAECQDFSPVVGIGTPPPPHPQAIVPSPPPFGTGGRGILAGERGGWQSPNFNEGTYTVVLYIYVYFVVHVPLDTICRRHGRGITISYPFILSTAWKRQYIVRPLASIQPSVQKRLATEPEVMSLLRHLILVILWRAGGGIHFSANFTLKILEYKYSQKNSSVLIRNISIKPLGKSIPFGGFFHHISQQEERFFIHTVLIRIRGQDKVLKFSSSKLSTH